jgi:hypothetical protein
MATKYGAIITSTATLSLTAGAADASFPLSNLASGTRPDLVFKSTGATCTIRATFGGATTVQAVGIANHNRPGTNVTLTSSAGLNTTLALPADAEDGQCTKGWKDLTGISGSTGLTTLDVAIPTGSGNAAIGGLAIVTTLSTMDITWGVTHADMFPIIEHRTEYDVSLIYDLGIRYRLFSAMVKRESERAAITSLHRTVKGRVTPFFFVLDHAINDWAPVRFKEMALPWERVTPLNSNAEIELEEVSSGLAL